MSEVICDGESLYVSYIIESEKPFRNLGYDILGNQMLYERKGKVSFTNEILDNGRVAGIKGEWKFKINVNVDKGITKKVNTGFENENGIAIKEVVITPFEIKVITQHNESQKNNYSVKLIAENGREIR